MKASNFNFSNWVSTKLIRINTVDRVALWLRGSPLQVIMLRLIIVMSSLWELMEESEEKKNYCASTGRTAHFHHVRVSGCQSILYMQLPFGRLAHLGPHVALCCQCVTVVGGVVHHKFSAVLSWLLYSTHIYLLYFPLPHAFLDNPTANKKKSKT